jgi:hypothetical protein
MTNEDHVSYILVQWAAERPDVDVSPMGVVGCISRLLLVVEKQLEPVFAQQSTLAALLSKWLASLESDS